MKAGVLNTGAVGSTHGVLAPAAGNAAIGMGCSLKDPAFSVCDDYAYAACNVLRWDRLHRLPGFHSSRVLQLLSETAGREPVIFDFTHP